MSATNAQIVVNGDAGNDTITGSLANLDSLVGGAGDDTFRFATSALFAAGETVSGGADTDTILFTGSGLTIADAQFANKSLIEKVTFTSGANSIVIDTLARAAGVATVVGGTGNDNIGMSATATDAMRSGMTWDLTSGGTDTVVLRNVDIGNYIGVNPIVFDPTLAPAAQGQRGFGGALVNRNLSPTTGESNADTLNATYALWDQAGKPGTSYLTITGFQAGAGGDLIDYALGADSSVLVGGFANNVSLVSNDLSPLAPNSVIEINANEFQISDPTNLLAVATMLDALNNVQDGTYYIVIYDGNGTGAYVYVATATEGDGFDFAEAPAGAFDTDTLELIAEITGVTANSIDASNFGGG